MIGQTLDGRYRIDAPIARGGMSMVFRGVDTRLDRPVAIKVMDPKFAGDPQFLTRFELEARAVATLKHPALVAVYDQGVDGEYPFLIMELVEGGTLRELLRERGPMPPHAARAVAEPVLEAIGVAHRAGLVHRDIKPENVLISDSGEVKIADFGLVRAVAGSNLTSASVILGTAAYLSPEQVSDGHADERSDVYSAGVLIFEMLTGRTPFTGDTSLSIAYQRVEKDVPSPSRFISGVPPEIDELVARATAREPAHRYPDASEMARDLRRIAGELHLPEYRVPAPRESAEHVSARYRIAAPPAPAPPRPLSADTTVKLSGEPPVAERTRVLTAARGYPEQPGYPETRNQSFATPPPVRAPAPYPPSPAERGRSRRRILIWTAVVVTLGLLLGVGGWWLGMGRYASVPPIAGLDVPHATGRLHDAGFETTTRNRTSDTVPSGGVIGTDPSAGAHVVKGSTVAVLLSSGKPQVPQFQPGQDVQSVQQAIRDQGLQPVDGGERPSAAAKGTVAQVDPAPGTVLPLNAAVKVYRSKGTQPVKIPDVKGQTSDAATQALTAAGLVVRDTRKQFDRGADAGSVIGTDPAAGTAAQAGDGVTLVVSDAVRVPNEIGKSAAVAQSELEALGLTVSVTHILSDGHGTVRVQSPVIGTLVEPGTTVTLTILPF